MRSRLNFDIAHGNTIFALRSVLDVNGKTMTLAQFTGFLNGSILADPMFAASFDDATKKQLQQVNGLIQMAADRTELDAATLGGMFGLDGSMSALVFRLCYAGAAGDTMSLEELVTFSTKMS